MIISFLSIGDVFIIAFLGPGMGQNIVIMFHLIGWDLVYVRLLLHQYDSLHGLVWFGLVLGERPETRFPPEFLHDGRRRRRTRLMQASRRFPNPRRSLYLDLVNERTRIDDCS